MDKDNLISFPGKKITQKDVTSDEEKTVFIYNCSCFYDIQKGLRDTHTEGKLEIPNTRFYILEDGYECSFCGRFTTFEQVHGSI